MDLLAMARLVPALHPIPFEKALSWVDGATSRLPAESAPVSSARSRVLTEEVRAGQPIPITDRAAVDGFAVQASATFGASSYNPLLLPLRAISAGEAMPAGADAVIPWELGQALPPGVVECVEPVAPGENVEAQGSVAASGELLAPSGTQISPRHIGVLISAGLSSVRVVRRPVVRIVAAPGRAVTDSNGPMIRALCQRDGGLVEDIVVVERNRHEIRDALATKHSDIVLAIGGTGPGTEDYTAASLAEAGELSIHGIALRPGETTALGSVASGVPVVLLPGAPAACLFSYELLAGQAIRRLGGRDPRLPYRSIVMRTAQKIVSSIGITEICPVRCGAEENTVEPLPSIAETGLMGAVAAQGFVIVPESSEGYPQDALITVYLYERDCIDG